MLGARDTVPTTEEPILIYLEVGFPCERRPLHGTIKAAKHHSPKEHVSPQPSASALLALPLVASHPQNAVHGDQWQSQIRQCLSKPWLGISPPF